MIDEKYVVMKNGDYLEMRAKLMHPTSNVYDTRADNLRAMDMKILPDAVVIRTQDVFAAGGLASYANQIQVFLSQVEEDEFEPGAFERLQAIKDYFKSVAEEAQYALDTRQAKLPD